MSCGSTNLCVAAVCDHDLEINPMTLKLENDLDILFTLKMKLLAFTFKTYELEFKNMKISLKVKCQGQNVKSSKLS